MAQKLPLASRFFMPEAASVPAARRFVRGVLIDAGHESWLDEAQLAVSELCTNAMQHAHSRFEVTVRAAVEGVYIQVWDDEPLMPVPVAGDLTSTTGRGLELVEAVASCFGHRVVGTTKVVWFCLGDVVPDAAHELLLDRSRLRDDTTAPAADAGEPIDVVLVGMPVPLWLAGSVAHNDLVRELVLHDSEGGRIPEPLVAADRARVLLLAALGDVSPAAPADVRLRVRPQQGPWFEALRDVVDRGQRLAASGWLLAAPIPTAMDDVRRWVCAEVLRQLDGQPPTAWDGPVTLPAAETTEGTAAV